MNPITFLDLFLTYRFDIAELASKTDVSQGTLRKMLNCQPVPRTSVLKVFSQLSENLHRELKIEHYDIALLSSFKEVLERHSTISIPQIAEHANVLQNIVVRMIEEKPVLKELATNVLNTLSDLTKHVYTLDTVDINIYVIVDTDESISSLMQRIKLETESAQLALHGLSSGTSKHQTITHNMELLSESTGKLYSTVGDEIASQYLQTLGG